MENFVDQRVLIKSAIIMFIVILLLILYLSSEKKEKSKIERNITKKKDEDVFIHNIGLIENTGVLFPKEYQEAINSSRVYKEPSTFTKYIDDYQIHLPKKKIQFSTY